MTQEETHKGRRARVLIGGLVAIAIMLSAITGLSQLVLYSDNKKAESVLQQLAEACQARQPVDADLSYLCEHTDNPSPPASTVPTVIVTAKPEVLVYEGAPGKDGKDGQPGANGVEGASGANGVDGKDGTPGVDGKDGADGKDGVNGTNGKDGRGVSTLNFNMKDCTVDIVYTDGTTETGVPMTGCNGGSTIKTTKPGG